MKEKNVLLKQTEKIRREAGGETEQYNAMEIEIEEFQEVDDLKPNLSLMSISVEQLISMEWLG